MAKIRRVVRKVEPTAAHYFDEQLWPIQIALVVLGGFLMGVSLAQLSLSGVAWYRTAWPSLIVIPLVIGAAMVAMAHIGNRVVRRSLQLSLLLCAILHVALVVQMVRTQLFSDNLEKQQHERTIVERPPPKIVPVYHPTQLVPEEDRPRQDFEKPVETQSPEPMREPVRIVREVTDQEQSPTLPQPVPTAEQRPTTEPNVVNRPTPNEAAPRLAAQTSRLSRQIQPSQSHTSQPVAMPAAPRELAAGAEVQPTATPLVRQQQAESATVARSRAEPTAKNDSRESQLARRISERAPAAETAATRMPRRTTNEATPPAQSQVTAAEPPTPAEQPSPPKAQAASIAVARQNVPNDSRREPLVTSEVVPAPAIAETHRILARTEAPSPTPVDPQPSASTTPRRSISSTQVAPSSAKIETPATPGSSSSPNVTTAQPAHLALSRAEAGTAGGRRAPNLSTSLPGAASPALLASAAARRAEATQRDAAGDALSPSAPARIARSLAAADIPSSAVKAEQLASATTAGTTQVAEVTASSGAAQVRADGAARHDAVTAAKGAGEIDFGPTQIVTEAGSGRAAGGGQPKLNRNPSPAMIARRSVGGAPANAIDARAAADDLPPVEAAGRATPSTPTAATAMVTARTVSEGAAANGRPPSADSGVSAAPSALTSNSLPARATTRDASPAVATDPARTESGSTSGVSGPRAPAEAAGGGTTSVADIPEVGPRSAVAQAELDHVTPGIAQASMSRTRGDGLPVNVEAPLGPGGLGTDFTPEVGINTRQARADSMNVELRSARFLRSQVGGLPAVSTAAVVPAEAFSSRAARVRGDERAGGSGSRSPETEEAIERGLAFLARYQAADGGWSLQGFPEGATLVSDTAATALALLAFQGAGYNHREFQYRDVVRGGIAQLLKSQKENGDLFVPLDDASNKSVWLYSHSLAAIAICEAYGMTQDPELRLPAQKAIDFIIAGQHAERGGWRYSPGIGTDTSVTGWMMMALKSGELAGLDVPPATYRKIARWLDDAQQSKSEPHLYRYNPFAPDTAEQRHGRAASKTMTAVGLLMRLYTGWRRDNPNMIRGGAFLAENLPALGTTRDPQRDTYYWYYATQVMAHIGGEPWKAWMGRLHPLLTSSQIRQGSYGGSWDPRAPIADRWGQHAGRLYVTTMNLLSLEVQYRKLPLYEDVAK